MAQNQLEKEIQSLETTIRKLEKLIPRKDGSISKKLYGKAYRIANAKFLSTFSGENQDKWIAMAALSGDLATPPPKTGLTTALQSTLYAGPPIQPDPTKPTKGLGETLEYLLLERDKLRKLLTVENIDKNTEIPNSVRHLYPTGKGLLMGGYINPNYNAQYEDEVILRQRNIAKKDFYNEYGRGWRGGKARRMTSKEKLAIMSKNFSPHDPLYTGDLSIRGHLGITTSLKNIDPNIKDKIVAENQAKNNSKINYSDSGSGSGSIQRTNRSNLGTESSMPMPSDPIWEEDYGKKWALMTKPERKAARRNQLFINAGY